MTVYGKLKVKTNKIRNRRYTFKRRVLNAHNVEIRAENEFSHGRHCEEATTTNSQTYTNTSNANFLSLEIALAQIT